MRFRTTLLAFAVLPVSMMPFGSSGCGPDHTSGVAPAVVAPGPAETSRSSESPMAASRYVIDRATSSVGFTGAKVTASHDGTFSDFSGTMTVPERDPTRGRVSVTIQMRSLEIEPPRLAAHLKSPDLLDVERFPTASFESTSIVAGGSGEVRGERATHTVTGTLTMHGQSRTISFPAVIEVSDETVRARAEFSINRQEFGITYPGMPDDLIRDAVVIRFDVRATRAEAAAGG